MPSPMETSFTSPQTGQQLQRAKMCHLLSPPFCDCCNEFQQDVLQVEVVDWLAIAVRKVLLANALQSATTTCTS